MNKRQKEVLQKSLKNERQVLEKIEKNYREALKEVQEKIKILQADELTQSKIYQLEYQKALEKQVNGILEMLKGNNFSTVQEYLEQCYEMGFFGTLYDIHGQGIPLIFPIDQEEVAMMIQKTHDDIKLSDRLYDNVDSLKDDVISEISRGISNGYSWQQMAQNLAFYSDISINRALTIARTEGHRVQNECQMETLRRAKEAGAESIKQWDSTLDGRTRKSHQKLDGQMREIEEYFEIDGHKALYPGGFGIAKEDIQCRCAMLQRAKWMLDEEELEELKERAEFFGLDKTKDLEDFKRKYLDAVKNGGASGMGMNLQLFAKDNKENVLKKISEGQINKAEFHKCYEYFKKKFSGGVKTPISVVKDTKDRFYHIVDRHEYMMSEKNIDRIVNTLEQPTEIYESVDKLGFRAICYIEKTDRNPLIVIDRNGIITSYEPDEKYLEKIRKGNRIWKSKE